ncbi:TetR/AcrR family transcriptional regulator [Aquisalinus flavus]|uniref:HTH tetR-type domain-containing protein n=1 Tax=Aquisalinus flavus TaxID=1526572 RepID=A0A8J2Y5K2_9PROT|nr:TetR/AcrR family transcriptional regulator [Aquisalinus flavus]MBD0425667.1 TetR/AcrR family transcriptional regulator [Aquisalinus flavus]UNE48719.1 TetR/AcrR family transcriptional regulator [Aquisalinus flavus]GGD14215.1 hypothetical protein GCM10011342_23750 [Aquisalinus flavus]
MADPKSPDEIRNSLEAVFRHHGYDGVSIRQLSEATGLSRTSLYRQYPRGKQQIGETALHNVVYWVCYHLVLPLRTPGPPHDRMQQVADALEEFYDGGMRPCMIELFTFGEAGRLYGETTSRLVEELIDAFAAFYIEQGNPDLWAQKRAEKNITLLQGALVLCRVRNSRIPFRQFLKKLMKTV